MRLDGDIKRDVEAELCWDPEVDDTDIAVKVNGGVVTLSGYARSYYEQQHAEQTAKRVAGVTAVANDVLVRLDLAGRATDPEIAREVIAALQYWLPISWEKIKPVVRDGHVMLDGTVAWHYQRERAENAVRRVKGVSSVDNSIRVMPTLTAGDIKHKIEDAFRRSAEIDARHVAVDADGTEVTLRGEVRSWSERDQAQQSAWSAPGVTRVINELRVRV
jgi:osmotically-inducible protein OsmY